MFLIKKKKSNEKLKFKMFILKPRLQQLHQQGKKLLIFAVILSMFIV